MIRKHHKNDTQQQHLVWKVQQVRSLGKQQFAGVDVVGGSRHEQASAAVLKDKTNRWIRMKRIKTRESSHLCAYRIRGLYKLKGSMTEQFD
jgi:hypothetical protein